MRAAKNRIVQSAVRVIAIVGPLTGLPQVVDAWRRPPASGISLLSWSLFLTISAIWLSHALREQDHELALSNALWIVVDVAIIIGILVSRINS